MEKGYNVIGMCKTKKGFTLIELLVAISIIAILSSIGMVNFLGSQKKGRDVRRQSDLSQYRIALENYATVVNGNYPVASGVAGTALTTFLTSYMSGFPTDPQTTYTYRYASDGSVYVLDACMEVSTKLFEMCSNGKSGITTVACSAGRTTTCDL